MRNLGFIPFSIAHAEIKYLQCYLSKKFKKCLMEVLNFYITFQKFRELGTPNFFLPNAEHLGFMKPKISYINLL